jgi:sec-independent protein translocase protein TatA
MRVGPFGLTELLIVLAILLLIFGARRLPEMGSSLGKSLRLFKSSVTGEDEKKVSPDIKTSPTVEPTLQSHSNDENK